MTTITRDTAPDTAQAPVAVIMERVLADVRAHLRGEERAPVYLATGWAGTGTALAALGAAAATVRAAGQGERLLVGTGGEFARLWQQTLQGGMTPVVRRALAARRIILLDGLEALRDEPVAQWELARLIVPGRLVILAGHGHLRHVAAWSPVLAARLAGAADLCLHDGPCVTDADAWTLIDRVAGYYGITRAQLLSRRRPAHIALARQVAMHLLRADGLPSMRVGGLLRRHHATILHGDARIRHLAAGQSGLRHDLDALRRIIAA